MRATCSGARSGLSAIVTSPFFSVMISVFSGSAAWANCDIINVAATTHAEASIFSMNCLLDLIFRI